MTKISAYINFPGNTEEAMTFYRDSLGGELQIIPIDGSPIENEMPTKLKGKVLHSALTKGALEIMASDMECPTGVTTGNNISLMLNCSNEDEIRTFFDKLSQGGQVISPVNPAFWGGLFGNLTDKFGIHWLLNCGPEGQN